MRVGLILYRLHDHCTSPFDGTIPRSSAGKWFGGFLGIGPQYVFNVDGTYSGRTLDFTGSWGPGMNVVYSAE